MIGLPDRVNIAAETRVGLCEIAVVRDRPERGAVAVNDDRLARHDPPDDLPAAVLSVNAERHRALVIGMARPDDRDRKTAFAVLLHEEFLTGDLVA